uniref:Uncharacterized protein n=1 Tax=Kalanchoe fedtschenkoi TaxID=63787 RepID=A0A7N0R8A9_KALFE
MAGSESEAVFNSFNLNPQVFVNEILNSVDDTLDGAFRYYHQEAAKIVGTGGTDRAADLEKGVVMLKKIVQRVLDQKLGLWEKYCISHLFAVPDGFKLPEQDKSFDDISVDVDGLTDLDGQLGSLRNKLTEVGKETAELNREMQMLEKKAALINHRTAAVNEALQIYEQNSADDMFQEMMKTASELRTRLEKVNSKWKERAEDARYERIHDSSPESSMPAGFSKAKLEELQKFVLDMKSMVN